MAPKKEAPEFKTLLVTNENMIGNINLNRTDVFNVLDSGSSYFLPRLIGSARAFEMATLGTKLSAQQAFEWGIVNRLVTEENLDAAVNEIATIYANGPTKAYALMKKMLNKSFQSDL